MPNEAASSAMPFVVVVGVKLEDTQSSAYALDQAARLASRIPGSQLHIVSVLSEKVGKDEGKEAADQLQRYLMAKAVELGGLSRQTVGLHVRGGDPGREIAQLASEVGAALVVVGGEKGRELKHLFVGSMAERVIESAACPVFIAGPRPKPATSDSVAIEPACPDCVETRRATHGRTWWCVRHSGPPSTLAGGARYSYQAEYPFAMHDSEVTATGI